MGPAGSGLPVGARSSAVAGVLPSYPLRAQPPGPGGEQAGRSGLLTVLGLPVLGRAAPRSFPYIGFVVLLHLLSQNILNSPRGEGGPPSAPVPSAPHRRGQASVSHLSLFPVDSFDKETPTPPYTANRYRVTFSINTDSLSPPRKFTLTP